METNKNTILPVGSGTGASAVLKESEPVFLEVTNLPTAAELEEQYINLVLKQTGGSKAKAAKILGFSVKTIYNKLDGYKARETVRDSSKGS